MHKYSAFNTSRSRVIDEKAENSFSFDPNYCNRICPKRENMAPREIIPNKEPERLSNSVPSLVPTTRSGVEEVQHQQLRLENSQINDHVVGAEAAGTRVLEERSLRPDPICRCEMKIESLEQELNKARHQIGTMSIQMEEQSSHLHHLMEERYNIQSAYLPEIGYPLFAPGYNTYPQNEKSQGFHPGCSHNPTYGRNKNQFCGNSQRSSFTNAEKNQLVQGLNPHFVSQLTAHNPDLVDSLNDEVMSLHMANLKLNLYLKKEESRRKIAEEDLLTERGYIKQLEDNIQNLKSSRIVMDPKTYKQVADTYIASRKRPVRRSHTCHPCIAQTDLVCDNGVGHQSKLFVPAVISCPSSPLNAKATNANEEQNIVETKANTWLEGEQRPMQREEYDKIFNSLAKLDLISSPSCKSKKVH